MAIVGPKGCRFSHKLRGSFRRLFYRLDGHGSSIFGRRPAKRCVRSRGTLTHFASLICRHGRHRGRQRALQIFRPSWRPACYFEKWSERCFYGLENFTIRMLRIIVPSSSRIPVIADRRSRRVKGFVPSVTRGDGEAARSFQRVG
jgi:hypothetical protein